MLDRNTLIRELSQSRAPTQRQAWELLQDGAIRNQLDDGVLDELAERTVAVADQRRSSRPEGHFSYDAARAQVAKDLTYASPDPQEAQSEARGDWSMEATYRALWEYTADLVASAKEAVKAKAKAD